MTSGGGDRAQQRHVINNTSRGCKKLQNITREGKVADYDTKSPFFPLASRDPEVPILFIARRKREQARIWSQKGSCLFSSRYDKRIQVGTVPVKLFSNAPRGV